MVCLDMVGVACIMNGCGLLDVVGVPCVVGGCGEYLVL